MGLIDKIIKNNTASKVDIGDAGARVAASGQYTVPPELFPLFANSANSGDLETLITAGTLTINNGITDLPVELGIAHMRSTIYEGIGSPSIVTGVTCDPSVAVGDIVKLNASGVAESAIASAEASSRVIGLVESKFSSTKCDIRLSGVGGELFTGLDTSKTYFLSPSVAGGITSTFPSGDEQVIVPVGHPITDKRLIVNFGLRIELDSD